MIPTSRAEMDKLGWEQADVILFSGDAFVDHPAFGAAVLARMLQFDGFKVAVVAQPNWRDDLRDFKKLGKPALFFGVTAGNMDSMVNHYTANLRLRSDDAYTPGGKAGARPDYATVVYSRILKKLYPDSLLFIGGIEASMRRFTHYDYWSDKLLPGMLCQAPADLLFYGMAEYPLLYAAQNLRKGESLEVLKHQNQTQFLAHKKPENSGNVEFLYSHKNCLRDKTLFAKNFKRFEQNANALEGKTLIQECEKGWLVTNPQEAPLSTKKTDKVYNLPYTRQPHPRYKNSGEIPAFDMIRNSVNIHRGCFGGCAFCTIAAHQGRWISSRSEKSILKEVAAIAEEPDFKGHITDLGGPSANMYKMHGIDMNRCRRCKRPSCIFPSVCDNLNTNHQPLTQLYQKLRKNQQVKKVTIGSGIRYDLILAGPDKYRESGMSYLEELILHHVSGRLKVAPEHTEDHVLKKMRKPPFSQFLDLKKQFNRLNQKHGKKQQLIPYFISSHPGCQLEDMMQLSAKASQNKLLTDQVQDFTPTPMTLATVMYYTGIDPYTGKEVETARTIADKKAQQKYFFPYLPENQKKIKPELRSYQLSSLEQDIYGSKKTSRKGKRKDKR